MTTNRPSRPPASAAEWLDELVRQGMSVEEVLGTYKLLVDVLEGEAEANPSESVLIALPRIRVEVETGPVDLRLVKAGAGGASSWAWVVHEKVPEWAIKVMFDPAGRLGGLSVVPREAFERARHEGTENWETTIDLTEGSPALTARILRSLPLPEIEAAVRLKISWLFPPNESIHTSVPLSQKRNRPGRKPTSDRELAALASRYVELLGSGRLMQKLASEFHLNESTVRGRLSEARRRGLLTATAQGRSGGSMTTKALRALEVD